MEEHDERVKKDLRLRVHGVLVASKVRLWMHPWAGPDSEKEMQALADAYAQKLNTTSDVILPILIELRDHSMKRLAAGEHFEKTGVATLRVTLTSPANDLKNFTVELKLDVPGGDLVAKIAEKLSVENDRIKLIHRGCLIKQDLPLTSQKVMNGAEILVLVLSDTPDEIKKNSDMHGQLSKTMRDAEFLSEDCLGENYLQLEDQSGKELSLPAHERKALMVAMTLHEKGRTALKAENYSLALIFLLEADKRFSECSTGILDAVDNYGLLNLDIAWCYLALQSVTQLPQAEMRLHVCEKSFHKSYGENLERLIALKGTTGNEKALFMRLHLLQGIVKYHQNQRDVAKALFLRAQEELNALKINETSLCNLVEMGYTESEARIGLRASEGNLGEAVNFILKARKQKDEKAKKAEEDREGRLLGLCDDKKQFVSVSFLNMLVNMGFSRVVSVIALKKSNNVISDAVSIIQEQGDGLLDNYSYEDSRVDKYLVEELVEIGYDPSMAAEALRMNFNDLNNAIDWLTTAYDMDAMEESSELPSSSGGSRSSRSKHDAKKIKKMEAAFSRLSKGIDKNTESDYLDISLEKEEEYLRQYLQLLL